VLGVRHFARFIDNDVTVSVNFQHLYARGMEEVFEEEAGSTTIAAFREKIIGDIQKNFKKAMPDLSLDSLGNSFKVQTFRFSKGTAKGFNYKTFRAVRRPSSISFSTSPSNALTSTIRSSASTSPRHI